MMSRKNQTESNNQLSFPLKHVYSITVGETVWIYSVQITGKCMCQSKNVIAKENSSQGSSHYSLHPPSTPPISALQNKKIEKNGNQSTLSLVKTSGEATACTTYCHALQLLLNLVVTKD